MPDPQVQYSDHNLTTSVQNIIGTNAILFSLVLVSSFFSYFLKFLRFLLILNC